MWPSRRWRRIAPAAFSSTRRRKPVEITPASGQTRTEAPVADHIRGDGQRGGGRPHELRAGSYDLWRRAAVYIDKILKGAKRPSCRSTRLPVPARHQSQDRERARPDDPAIAAAPGGSGYRVIAMPRLLRGDI